MNVITTLLLIVVVVFITLQFSVVQTYVAQKAAEYLSEKTKTTISIEKISLNLISDVEIHNLYIQDLNKDTFVYVQKLKAEFDDIDFVKREIYFKHINIDSANVKIIFYKNLDDYNFQFLIDAFDNGSKNNEKSYGLNVDQLLLNNSNFTYKDEDAAQILEGFNYNGFVLSHLNLDANNFRVIDNEVYAKIKYLTATDTSGLQVNNMQSTFALNPQEMSFLSSHLKTEHSTIEGDVVFKFNNYKELNNFNEKVKINSKLRNTTLSLDEVAFFAPELKGIRQSILLNADVTGKVTDLKTRNVTIKAGNNTLLSGNFDFIGLPNIDETYMFLDIKKLQTNYTDITQIPEYPFEQNKKITINPQIKNLGNIKFKGNFSGFINDFVAFGKMQTALGEIVSDIKFYQPSNTLVQYSGSFASNNFNIGKLFGYEDYMKNISMTAKIEGRGLKIDNINATLKGKISSFEVNQYPYQNIVVEGKFTNKLYDGFLTINDPNAKLNFEGKIDFKKDLPIFDFSARLDSANLVALNFAKQAQKALLSSDFFFKFKGNEIDNLEGSILISNIQYQDHKQIYTAQQFLLEAHENENQKNVKLSSDFADAYMQGNFKIVPLLNAYLHQFAQLFPSLKLKTDPKAKYVPQNYIYELKFKNTNALSEIFYPQIKISTNSYLKGSYNDKNQVLIVDGHAAELELFGSKLKNWFIDIKTHDDLLTLKTGSESFNFSNLLMFQKFTVNSVTQKDELNYNITWDNSDSLAYKGNIKGRAKILGTSASEYTFYNSEIILADSVWQINNNNYLVFDTTGVYINNLLISNAQQTLFIDGKSSKNTNDILNFELKNFNCQNLNNIINQKKYKIGGMANGNFKLSKTENKQPLFTGEINIKNFAINAQQFGNLDLKSNWNFNLEHLNINGLLSTEYTIPLNINGYYAPNEKNNRLNFNATLTKMDIAFLEPLLDGNFTNLKGWGYGNLQITGTEKEPNLCGNVQIQQGSFFIPYLNTNYYFNSKILFDEENIQFETANIYDTEGNLATLNGKIKHNYFDNISFDLNINAKEMLVLNTKSNTTELYYGKAYVSGITKITGNIDKLNINANVKTNKGTQLFIPLNNNTIINDNNFITFTSPQKKDTLSLKQKKTTNITGINFHLDCEATPDAEVQIIFDQQVGDIIKSKGNGMIEMQINTAGEFTMFGDYIIEEGDYLFTLKNVINKKFIIEKGSKISWKGDPYDANVNITALYKLRTSLYPLLATIDTSSAVKRKIPLSVNLLLTEKMMTPTIKFDIQLPNNTDENTKTQFRSQINTEQELQRQVFALLVLNSFITPQQATNVNNNANLTTGINTTTTELLFNQFSHWLSQYTKSLDVGVRYSQGNQNTSEQVEIALSTQLFNDRLSIDGNLGVGGTALTTTSTTRQQNSNNVVGEFNMELKLNQDGRLRAKAFNRSNESNLINNAMMPYTQGIGLSYRKDFSKFKDMLKSKKNLNE